MNRQCKNICVYVMVFFLFLLFNTKNIYAVSDNDLSQYIVLMGVDKPIVGSSIWVDYTELLNDKNVEFEWYRNDEFICNDSSYLLQTEDYCKWIRVKVKFNENDIIEKSFFFSKLPVIYINTDDEKPITSKMEYKTANMRIQGNNQFQEQYNGGIAIKGRGNSSWGFPKKPYKIKLDNKKALFGFEGINKHYVLLANYLDESLMRNTVAFDISRNMGLATMETEWVDVVVNGTYMGNYQLCEQIRIGEGRINIFDWEGYAEGIVKKLVKNNPELTKEDQEIIEEDMKMDFSWVSTKVVNHLGVDYDISKFVDNIEGYINGGYIFELSNEYDELSQFTTHQGLKVMVDFPEYLYTNDYMMNNVTELWQDFENAYYSYDGYNEKGKHYTEYADIDSMVNYWLTMEIVGNNDAAYKSRFVYKDINEKLVFGPVWDFDYGGGSSEVGTNPVGWKVTANLNEGNFWRQWVDDPFFQMLAAEKYWAIRDYLQTLIDENGVIDGYVDYLSESAVENEQKWLYKRGFSGKNGDAVLYKKYLTERIEWLDKQFATSDSTTKSLMLNVSANTYHKDSKKSLRLINTSIDADNIFSADGICDNNTDLKVSVSDNDIEKLDVYVNGIRCDAEVYNCELNQITIPYGLLTRLNGINVISVVAKDKNDFIKYTDYITVRLSHEDSIVRENIVSLIFDAGSETNKEELERNIQITTGTISDNSILIASLDGLASKKLHYSGASNPAKANIFVDGKISGTFPVLEAKATIDDLEAKPWTENTSFTLKTSTVSYDTLQFSASLAATNKGFRDYILQYSLDGKNYVDIPQSEVSLGSVNKQYLPVFNHVELPDECNNQDVIYIRIKVNSNYRVNGDLIHFGESTDGSVTINNIVLAGRKIEHSLVHNVKVDSTCTIYGEVEHWYCEKCNQYFINENATHRVTKENIQIEPIGHKFSTYISNKDATCTEDGTKTAKCERCVSENTIPDLNSKLGHDWNDGTIMKPTTYESTGTKVYKCSRCDEEWFEVIPKLIKVEQESKGDGANPSEPVKQDNKEVEKEIGKQENKEFVDKKSNATYKVLKTSDGSRQVVYVHSNQVKAKAVKIPNEVIIAGQKYSVTQIAEGAFKRNKYLTSVTIGKNVAVIKDRAFENCSKLKKVKFSVGQKLIIIQAKAFMNCKALKNISIPKSVSTIGMKAFYNCTKLKKVTINGSSIKKVGNSAFKNMAPKSVIKVKKRMFNSYKKIFAKKYTSSKTMMSK